MEEAATWSCEVRHVQRLRLYQFSSNLFTGLKDLFVSNTLCSPTRDNMNRASHEEVPYFDHSFMLPESFS